MSYTSETIDFAHMTPGDIKTTLARLKIQLTVEEVLKIQNDILGRPPRVSECILWSIQGSEHSSYKSSRKYLSQFVTDGPDVILGPSEDAGVVSVATDNEGKRYGIVMSHESHNHPSQIVPYEGAATGVGGNVRDVSCMGAKVIAVADPLRFGDISSNKTRWIHDGVVSGIAGYANPIGVPNIAGDVYYNESYNDNCLVNVVTLGVLREDRLIHSKAPANAVGYDYILVGKPTDNSGFGGASFASVSMDEEEKEQNTGAVQEPNAFIKRHLLKATYALFDILEEKQLLDKVGFKDLGAGGIACATVELAESAGYGAHVTLDLVPRSMHDLHPAVILCSETQERYMWICHPDVSSLIIEHYNETFDLPNVAQGARAVAIGRITEDPMYVVEFNGQTIIQAKAKDITEGLFYDRPTQEPTTTHAEPNLPEPEDYRQVFLGILSHPNVASREPIYEQYDKQVQGITIIEPGQADAGVLQPFLDDEWPEEIRKTGIALSVDQNPRYCTIDPYWGAINAVVEAARNVAAVGATPHAMTDCLNFGNPEKKEHMWAFVRGVKGVADACRHLRLKHAPDHPVPIVSGNVSLYNESVSGNAIAPSPIIACLGRMDDVSQAIRMSFVKADSAILLVGERKNECGGSVYYEVRNELGAALPKPDVSKVQQEICALTDAIRAGHVLSAHDISDGGVATTLAEMTFGNDIGCSVSFSQGLRPDTLLFSETGGFVLEVDPAAVEAVMSLFTKYECDVTNIGSTTMEPTIKLGDVLDLPVSDAKQAWANGLRHKL